jgi:hypothetical protein
VNLGVDEPNLSACSCVPKGALHSVGEHLAKKPTELKLAISRTAPKQLGRPSRSRGSNPMKIMLVVDVAQIAMAIALILELMK